MRPAVHYLVREKNAHHGAAIARGFGARTVPAERRTLERSALHIIGGLQHGSLELMQQVMDAGEPYVFVDRAYFGGGPGTNCLRVVPSAYQHHWLERWPTDRLEAIQSQVPSCRLQDWRAQGAHVLLVPPSEAVCQLFGLGDWGAAMYRRLQDCFDGPIVVSRKGDGIPARKHFPNCWAVVTWTSNVAVEAVLAGVPAFVSPASAAWPVALGLDALEARIEKPYLADNRLAWAAALAYGQFDLSEIKSGYAAEIALAHFRDS